MKTLLTQILKSENRLSETIRFGLSGGVAVFVQYGLYLLFITVLNIKPFVATLTSYFISFCLNYYLSNKFTFHSRPTKKKAALFTVCHIINLSLQTTLVILFSKLTGPTYALAPAMYLSLPVNFLMVRHALKRN